MDYEKNCKRCGKCCTPIFRFNGGFVRLKTLRCIYLDENNLCTVYDKRKQVMGCFSPWELPNWHMPNDCAFGGTIREISGKEEDDFITTPSWELRLIYKTGLFDWRDEK